MSSNGNGIPQIKDYSAVISVVGSPIKFFCLTALISNSVFAIAAAILGDKEIFKYCIHMFIALIGVFMLLAIWCPRSLYHPTELKGIDTTEWPHRPFAVTAACVLCLVLYMAYMFFKLQLSR